MSDYRDMASKAPCALSSLPFPKPFKRYWWMVYDKMRVCNGPRYAAEEFSNLRNIILGLVAQGPKAVLTSYPIAYNSIRIRKNGWFRALIEYSATQPLAVLQLLKLYTCEKEPAVSVEEASLKQKDILEQALPGPDNPLLRAWLYIVSIPFGVYRKEHKLFESGRVGALTHQIFWRGESYTIYGDDASAPFEVAVHKMLQRTIFPCFKRNQVDGLRRYLTQWSRWLHPVINERELTRALYLAMPSEASYADMNFGKTGHRLATRRDVHRVWNPDPRLRDYHQGLSVGDILSSPQYEEDLNDLKVWLATCPQALMVLEQVDSWFRDMAEEGGIESSSLNQIPVTQDPRTWFGAVRVGNIHLIPKKGTYKRRAIAAPNRFFQACLRPCQLYLRSITRVLPRNCQFNQDKMNDLINQKVQSSEFVGCWDLSQATDYMPLLWFHNSAAQLDLFNNPLLSWSYAVFLGMCHGVWRNEEFDSSWKRGQPLGTWPSFEVLTLTHYWILESLSVYCGRLDSPFAICGDDNVIWDKQVHRLYGRLMKKAKSPISYHKSFEGRAVEFTGKLFIKGQPMAYCPNYYPVTTVNLFDYQVASQHFLKWKDLPRSVRTEFSDAVHKVDEHAKVEMVYRALQCILNIPGPELSKESGLIVKNFYRNLDNRADPDPETGTIWSYTSFGPMPSLSEKTLSRMRPVQEWFRHKYRPFATSKLIELACTKLSDRIPS